MASIANITFTCEDPGALADFWAEVLEYEHEELPPALLEAYLEAGGDPNDAAALVDPAGGGPRLYFTRGEPTPTESIPIHLDLEVEDREAAIQRLVGLGATEIETTSRSIGPMTETWTVLEDPAGNGFCVQAPPA